MGGIFGGIIAGPEAAKAAAQELRQHMGGIAGTPVNPSYKGYDTLEGAKDSTSVMDWAHEEIRLRDRIAGKFTAWEERDLEEIEEMHSRHIGAHTDSLKSISDSYRNVMMGRMMAENRRKQWIKQAERDLKDLLWRRAKGFLK